MVSNVVKYTIAGSLFIGAVIALFTFLGNLIGQVISKRQKKLHWFILTFLSYSFLFLIFLTISISAIILLTPTDLHIIGDLFR